MATLKVAVAIVLLVGLALAIVGVVGGETLLVIIGDALMAAGVLVYLSIRKKSPPVRPPS